MKHFSFQLPPLPQRHGNELGEPTAVGPFCHLRYRLLQLKARAQAYHMITYYGRGRVRKCLSMSTVFIPPLPQRHCNGQLRDAGETVFLFNTKGVCTVSNPCISLRSLHPLRLVTGHLYSAPAAGFKLDTGCKT